MKYTEDHEWLLLEDGAVTIGITEHSLAELGDLVFIELPEVGQEVVKGEEVAVIEGTAGASEMAAPLDGTVTEVNAALVATPSLVNEDPEAAWFFRMTSPTTEEMDQLMDADEYADFVG